MWRGQTPYTLELEDGTVSKARRVILATGHMGFRKFPDKLKGLSDGMGLHSTALHDLRQFAGRDVTVIGAGASALESLALLHKAGAKTRLVARRQQIRWNPPARPNPNLIERLRTLEAGLGPGWRAMRSRSCHLLLPHLRAGQAAPLFPDQLGPRGSVLVARSGRGQDRPPLGASDRFGAGRRWPREAWPHRPCR